MYFSTGKMLTSMKYWFFWSFQGNDKKLTLLIYFNISVDLKDFIFSKPSNNVLVAIIGLDRPFQKIFTTCVAQITIGIWWCAICFFFLRFYNFIKLIVRLYIIFLYTLYKAQRKSESTFSHTFLSVIPLLVMQHISSLIL